MRGEIARYIGMTRPPACTWLTTFRRDLTHARAAALPRQENIPLRPDRFGCVRRLSRHYGDSFGSAITVVIPIFHRLSRVEFEAADDGAADSDRLAGIDAEIARLRERIAELERMKATGLASV